MDFLQQWYSEPSRGAVVIGDLSALGAAFVGLGIQKNTVIEYEEALTVDGFLLVAHGPVAEMTQVQSILKTLNPIRLDLHQDVQDMPEPPADHAAITVRHDHNERTTHNGYGPRAQ